ncbi:MAG TPA: ribose-phosphate diphosphokinase [Gemmatimonadales bacterium]|nr:ribose-phosphate diphosphokinase [Gemmatimonadales bacterium]
MNPAVLALPGNDALGARLALELDAEPVDATVRRFPDGESYVRLETPIAGRAVVLAATLDRPDDKLMPLLLAAATARELGARSVGLVAPYLPYLRQDRRFLAGEAVSARGFAELLSSRLDWIVTVDPHLHRIHRLEEVYRIPAESITAAPRLAHWVREHVVEPVLIGPDEESRQWVEAVAHIAGAPCAVLRKQRRGDAEVSVELPDLSEHRNRMPVLVDDIISTGATLIQAVGALRRAVHEPPYCVAVHGVLAGGAYPRLLAAGAQRLVTCNTIVHPTNEIDVHDLLAAAAARQLRTA